MPSAVMTAAARGVGARRSMILGGHGVAAVAPELDPENLCVAPDRFRAQLELLLHAGWSFVSVGELSRRAAGGRPPPGLVALTFDDGMENNLSVLAPILREYGLPATVYVVAGLLGRPNPWMDARAGARMLTEDELSELAAAGIEIGAHTLTHPDLAALGESDCRREIQGSRDTLRELTGRPIASFAYPFFGHSSTAQRAVAAAGFQTAVVGEGRRVWHPLMLPRAMITGVDGPGAFLAKLAGAYGPVYHSAPGAAARVLTRVPRRVVRLRRGAAQRP